MQFTKIHVAGSDYLMTSEDVTPEKAFIQKLLDRRAGVGGEGFCVVCPNGEDEAALRLYLPDGRCGASSVCAAVAASKFLFDRGMGSRIRILLETCAYPISLTVMGNRVLCAWATMPAFEKREMEEQKYCYGTRGETVRECLGHPRIGIYDLVGAHAVFLLDSCAALRALDLERVCRRFNEVLFFGERIDLHFAAVAGDNALALRSWTPGVGESFASGEGAALVSAAAGEAALTDGTRIMVRCPGGSFCVDRCARQTAVCVKCERVFAGSVALTAK